MASGFVRETAHFDGPVTPLFSTLVLAALERGFARAQGGAARLELRVVDGHVYAALHETLERALAEESPPLDALVESWRRELLPELAHIHDELRALAPAHATPRRMAAALDRAAILLERGFEAHYGVTRGTQAGWALLEEALREAGDPAPARTVGLLLAPTESLLRNVDTTLAELAALVARAPSLRAALADPPALPAALTAHPIAAEPFARLWTLVSDRPARFEIAAPTWSEDPAPLALALLGGQDAYAAHHEATARALERRAEAERETLARFPADAAESVRAVLQMLRDARGVMQSVNFLAGEVSVGLARAACLRLGACLTRGGILPSAGDIFLLTLDEARAALEEGTVAKDLVATRRRLLENARAATPPDTLDGADEPPQMPRSDGRLTGLGASPGRASGRARIVRKESDLARVESGDVLVVAALLPSWTPAMLRASGVATEAGGMLTHAAIVAREMGRPAVVGVRGLLDAVQDGARVVVDGDAGEVTLAKEV